MQHKQVIKIVEQWLMVNGWKYDCILSCKLLPDHWISKMMRLGVFSDRQRHRVWEARVRLLAPSDTSCQSHNVLSVFVDDESADVDSYR